MDLVNSEKVDTMVQAEREAHNMRDLKQHDIQFKYDICKMVVNEGISVPVIAKEYSIAVSTVYGWVKKYREYGDQAFIGSGNLREDDAKMRALEQENKELKMENEILKKPRNSS